MIDVAIFLGGCLAGVAIADILAGLRRGPEPRHRRTK